ncbi:S-adenosylmethionine synthetase, partial [archaeon]
DGDEIPIDKIAIETAKKWFRENLRFVNPDVHVKYQVELKPGSEELISIFKRTKGFLGANDTSAAVGYAPMTPLEKLVLSLENYLNSSDFKSEFPETGEDVKVMGLRVKDDIDITIAMPFIDRYVDSEKTYFRLKSEVLEEINQHLEKTIGKSVKVNFNALDSPGKGVNGVYLTVLGTSAEAGDSGEVGRGNRVNGIIPLNRPTSSEAAAGKNPISHVGKIYNILSYRLAERVYSSVDGVKEIYVWLLSQIGEPIHQPKIVAAEVTLEKNVSLNSVKKRIEETLRSGLSEENLSRFLEDLIQGRIRVC